MNSNLFRCLISAVVICSGLCQAAIAQQDSAPPKSSDAPAAPKQDETIVTAPKAPIYPGDVGDPNSPVPAIRTINGAGPLPSGRVSAVQFGSLYLQSADFFQSIDSISATGQPNTLRRSRSTFRGEIVLDHAFRTSHFAVQYQPRLSVVDGNTSTDTANLAATWSTFFPITTVLGVSLNSSLSYYSQQSQFDNLNLMADVTTGSLVQSNFLEGSGHFLNERTELAVRYQLGPRSRLDVVPFFEYDTASGTQLAGESYSPGVTAAFGYALSATKSMGLSYEVRDTHFTKILPTTLYQAVNVSYSQLLSPTWRYSAAAGFATATSTGLGAPPLGGVRSTQTTATGSFNLIKSFRESSLAFQYYRGEAVGLQVTNGFADRFDVSYNRRLSQRVQLDLGVGYYREFLSATNTSGFYASGGVGYQIARRWSLQTVYAYKKQTNGGVDFATGQLHYISFGIRWEPGTHTSAF